MFPACSPVTGLIESLICPQKNVPSLLCEGGINPPHSWGCDGQIAPHRCLTSVAGQAQLAVCNDCQNLPIRRYPESPRSRGSSKCPQRSTDPSRMASHPALVCDRKQVAAGKCQGIL